MEGASTDSIRALAPKWSLAGDGELLNLLQNTHQKIITKCQDVNSKLEEMASALDDASINLQNVNNKFMALSNTQFIESRVYDDDELTPPPRDTAETPLLSTVDELSMLKTSLSILERAHETTEILDDSDSDSDAEISVVLKPKDVYCDRPLPYIIGTRPWKTKWHAGLIAEESDSDDSDCKNEERDIDLYSESGSEAEEIPRPRLEDRTVSESSSSSTPEPGAGSLPPPGAAATIAAELARRLGGNTHVVAQDIEDYSPPKAAVRKVYRPEQPATSTIFPDEPPPIDTYEQEEESISEEEEDIFAEINKHKPYTQRNQVQSNLAEDLFSFDKPEVKQGDIFSDFAAGNIETTPAKQKSSLFEDEPEPELFAEPPERIVAQNHNIDKKEEETGSKKPVGGISLFGSNKGAESIGAAILKRNQRKSSTSGDESGSDNVKNRNEDKANEGSKNIEHSEAMKSKAVDETDHRPLQKKEKDIFDDLFAKSQAPEKKPVKKITKEPVKVKEKSPIKDLFSDNIFDDIDDIFTSDVKMPAKESNQKSIFDDDNDLFSDIAKPISNASSKTNKKDSNKEKDSTFGSDDDMFSEVRSQAVIKNNESQTIKVNKTDKTTDINKSNSNLSKDSMAKTENIVKPTETTKERNLFDDSPQVIKSDKPQIKTKSIFESDSDDDIFAKIKTTDKKESNKTEHVLNNTVDRENIITTDSTVKKTERLKVEGKPNLIQSPSLFGEDEIDDLFLNANKFNVDSTIPTEIKIPEVESISKTSDAKSTVIDKVEERSKKINIDTLPNVDSTKSDNSSGNINEKQQKLPVKTVPTPTKEISNESNIFEDILEDNLFSTPKIQSETLKPVDTEEIVASEVIESSQDIKKLKTETNQSKPKDTKTPKVVEEEIVETKNPEQDANQSVFDDFRELVKEKEVLTIPEKKPISNEPDIFDDIFTEPPAFEKPAEPKKSKNVNALFDDDSDDESLFFKKSDVISDEKPEIFSKNANFDIFIDEPPAIDVDFTANSEVQTNPNDIDDSLFSFVPKMENVPRSVKKIYIDDDNEELFSTVSHKDASNIVAPERKDEERITETKTSNKVSEPKPESTVFPKDKDEILFNSQKVEKHANAGNTITEAMITNTSNKASDSDEDIFSSLSKPEIPKSSQINETSEQNITSKSNLDKNNLADDFEDIFKTKDSPTKETEAKKIGKLNTKNFNINVNALIPGASPKKVPKERKDEPISPESENSPKMVKIFPTNDEADNAQPKLPTNKVDNETNDIKVPESEPKAEKSITFDEKTESGILDNNVSKQRPKIQVKRRPSSRRARHEAVRKSAIDFGDDTDNSSSLDEPVKKLNVKAVPKNATNEDAIKHEDSPNIKDTQIENQIQDIQDKNKGILKDVNPNETNVFESQDVNISAKKPDEGTKQNDPSNPSTEHKRGSTTKIVYILNDEDIFNTGPENTDNKEKNLENNTEKDIFKNVEGIKTLGKTYTEHTEKSIDVLKKEVPKANSVGDEIENNANITKSDVKTQKGTKESLFDDSDDELFNKSKKIVRKTKLFDSDSEDDLFSGKKRTEKQSKEEKNRVVKERIEVNVKGSLFGDEDDDEDLFGVRKDEVEPNPQSSAPSTSKLSNASIASKTAEPVFDDPLSMLGDD